MSMRALSELASPFMNCGNKVCTSVHAQLTMSLASCCCSRLSP
eukprot:CAMPEP_0116965458 /NCGR_PEP_ID=MMETSP0467-20121206/49234_1 /TAXON_ID=283647 /ORGANISM="Mesodinium pulex, Strain SPMC105" /LENGTH=42 /DNA_ID= /DNA_START= /DNA_END= /DNA_ORIENTATION=